MVSCATAFLMLPTRHTSEHQASEHQASELDCPFLEHVLYSQTASGYIVNGHYIQELIDLYEYTLLLLEETHMHWVYANDQIWKTLQEKDNWYAFKRRLGKQRSGYSDNTQTHVNRST